jgi:hypothetical protein
MAKTGSNWFGSVFWFWHGFLGFGSVFSGFGSDFFGLVGFFGLARFWLGFSGLARF